MEIIEILLILIVAVVIGSIFYYGLGRRGPYGAFWLFLLVLFLAGIAGRFWITPAGPVMWGYAWFPLLFWIFLVAILIAAASPAEDDRVTTAREQDRVISRSDANRTEAEREVIEENQAAAGTAAALGIFFWLLLILLLIAIVAGLFR